MVYLVDTENVGFADLNVKKGDEVYYFVGNYEIDELKGKKFGMYTKDNKFYFVTDHNRNKNALDFIIDSSLGFLIHKYGKNTSFRIVSRDNGFKEVSNFWSRQGYDVSVVHETELLVENYNKLNYSLDEINKEFDKLPGKKKIAFRNICDELLNHEHMSYVNFYLSVWRSLHDYLDTLLIKDMSKYIFIVF